MRCYLKGHCKKGEDESLCPRARACSGCGFQERIVRGLRFFTGPRVAGPIVRVNLCLVKRLFSHSVPRIPGAVTLGKGILFEAIRIICEPTICWPPAGLFPCKSRPSIYTGFFRDTSRSGFSGETSKWDGCSDVIIMKLVSGDFFFFQRIFGYYYLCLVTWVVERVLITVWLSVLKYVIGFLWDSRCSRWYALSLYWQGEECALRIEEINRFSRCVNHNDVIEGRFALMTCFETRFWSNQ